MTEKEGKRYYTVAEVASILGIQKKRVHSAYQTRKLIPDDMVASGGRQGFSYVFSEDSVKAYARKIGIEPIFENWEFAHKKTKREKMAEFNAMRQVEKELNPSEDEGIIITAENVHEIFGRQEYEETELYIVRIGKGYILHETSYSPDKIVEQPLDRTYRKDEAEEIAEKYGGRVLQICLRDTA